MGQLQGNSLGQSAGVADLSFLLQAGQGTSLARRDLVAELRRGIERGQIPTSARLPPTRQLAREIGLARNTVASAYSQLVDEGYLQGKVGAGTFVTAQASLRAVPSDRRMAPTTGPRFIDMPPPGPRAPKGLFNPGVCRPSTQHFPNDAWRRSLLRASSQQPAEDYADPAGEEELRVLISAHLLRYRSLDVAPENITVTNGAAQAADLLFALSAAPGDRVAVEDPGYPTAWNMLRARGIAPLPIPVDDDGLCTEKLPEGPGAPRAVYVTPAHQFPLGARLSLARRRQLLAWARRHDALVIEDDYDGEFRYDVPPLPPLASLTGALSHVAYVGTFSKMLTPELRIGFVAGSSELTRRLRHLKQLLDYQSPTLLQRALAQMIKEGHLDRHVARMRRIYARRRAVLCEELVDSGVFTLRGLDAGMHLFLQTRTRREAEHVRSALRRQGVFLESMTDFLFDRYSPDLAGVLIGYGTLEDQELQQLGQMLAHAAIAAG
jgi:GntR family transcriptional regulator/MocR family aminotransferase